ncbi:MAG TPA: hypothetical protein VE690_18025 [Rhodopila sp.]|nr:hypothetical protein [Rhodopila sp.]
MSEHTSPAPHDTERLINAIRQALTTIPEVHRKAAFKHATDAVWRDLIEQAEHAKAASREAGPDAAAKSAAATNAYRT